MYLDVFVPQLRVHGVVGASLLFVLLLSPDLVVTLHVDLVLQPLADDAPQFLALVPAAGASRITIGHVGVFMGNNIFQRNSGSVSCCSNTAPCIVVKRPIIVKPKFLMITLEGKVGK